MSDGTSDVIPASPLQPVAAPPAGSVDADVGAPTESVVPAEAPKAIEAEIIEAFMSQPNKFGQTWTAYMADRSVDDYLNAESLDTTLIQTIAADEGTSTGPVYQHLLVGKILLMPPGGEQPKPSVAAIADGKGRSVLKRGDLSDEAAAHLEKRIVELQEVVSAGRDDLEETILEIGSNVVEEADRTEAAGVYVYSYPHYVNHPVVMPDDVEGLTIENSLTYYKVGVSTDGMLSRVLQQNRNNTNMPEEPTILRMYRCAPDLANGKEKAFHHLLDAAPGVNRSRRRRRAGVAGTEWFLTSLEFLDAIAEELGMEAIAGDDLEADGPPGVPSAPAPAPAPASPQPG